MADELLAERFEEHRLHLRAVVYWMLGSLSDADDAVQEAWIRLSRADMSGVENLGGCLMSAMARVVRGAAAVANRLMNRDARAAQPALVKGAVGVIVAPRGRLMMVLDFTIRHRTIVAIEAIGEPERLRQFKLAVLADRRRNTTHLDFFTTKTPRITWTSCRDDLVVKDLG